jgi:hypothetical protein
MAKKTRFEQVPLEVVKKVVEEQAKREETTESGRGTKKEELEEILVGDRQGQWERQKKVTHLLDIFRVETSGVLWVESAATIEDAKARVQELAVGSPAEYIVLDQKTGNKLLIKLDGVDAPGR